MIIKKTKIVLDTTFYIGRFMEGKFYKKLEKFFSDNKSQYQLVWSDALFNEIKYQLFTNEKVKTKVENYSKDKVLSFLNDLKSAHIEVTPLQKIEEIAQLTDREDYHLLELATQAEINCILTNDKVLLRMERFGKTKILSYRDFLQSTSA